MHLYNFLQLSALLFCAVACKKEDPLKNIDKKALFATPTSAELEAVRASWQSRQLTPVDVRIESTHEIFKDRLYYKIVSFRLQGIKQYVGALVPVTTSPLPVRMSVYGFSLTDPVIHEAVQTNDNVPFIYALPSLRGQTLSVNINGVEYKAPASEGTRNDAFDAATDDAIASLNALLTIAPQADASRVGVRGGSRGGTVALLMAIRDKRVKLAAGVAFPVDLLAGTSTHQNDPTYRFQFLDALINGSETLPVARQRLIASSPTFFYQSLPPTQMHFGEKDDITPPQPAVILFDKMKAAGMGANISYFEYSNRDHYNIGIDNPELQTRINTFLDQL
ncbi:MAG: prolyl oligopeptidase family serine peptidase [Niastella sp.]|nr:prolyl oligopeptidase family serine peptidase [Niastella sp.]